MLTSIIKKCSFHDTDVKATKNSVGKQVQLRFWSLASVVKYIYENMFRKVKAKYSAAFLVFLPNSGSIFGLLIPCRSRMNPRALFLRSLKVAQYVHVSSHRSVNPFVHLLISLVDIIIPEFFVVFKHKLINTIFLIQYY